MAASGTVSPVSRHPDSSGASANANAPRPRASRPWRVRLRPNVMVDPNVLTMSDFPRHQRVFVFVREDGQSASRSRPWRDMSAAASPTISCMACS